MYILKESQKNPKPKQTTCCNGEQAWVTSK